jgi:hypothetical protein
VKIIQEPIPEQWRYQTFCEGCEAILEVEASDLIFDKECSPEWQYRAVCLYCKGWLHIHSSDIPEYVMKVAQPYEKP